MPSPKTPPKAPAAIAGLALLVGAAGATELLNDTKSDEGVKYVSYRDLGGIWSICSGSTKGVKPGEVDSAEQCDARTIQDLTKAAKIVLHCAPNLKARHNQLRAVIRFQNNTGKFCTSSARPLFLASKWRAGCDALLRYNGIISPRPIRGAVRVRRLKDGRYFNEIRGLDNRRNTEHAVCVEGLA